MLKFATPQRLGVPSHRLITSSQRLIERLIKYKELYRNQREEKQSFPKEEFFAPSKTPVFACANISERSHILDNGAFLRLEGVRLIEYSPPRKSSV